MEGDRASGLVRVAGRIRRGRKAEGRIVQVHDADNAGANQKSNDYPTMPLLVQV